jgi:hypothetical protein
MTCPRPALGMAAERRRDSPRSPAWPCTWELDRDTVFDPQQPAKIWRYDRIGMHTPGRYVVIEDAGAPIWPLAATGELTPGGAWGLGRYVCHEVDCAEGQEIIGRCRVHSKAKVPGTVAMGIEFEDRDGRQVASPHEDLGRLAQTSAHFRQAAFAGQGRVDARNTSRKGLASLRAFLLRNRATITELNLAGQSRVDQAWIPLFQELGALKALDLSGCSRLPDALLAALPRTPERLDLTRCPRITDAGLGNLRGMSLKALSLGDDKARDRCKLTSAGFAHLAGLPLEELSLANLSYDPALVAFPAENLRTLNLIQKSWPGRGGKDDPTDGHLDALLSRAARLERLKLMVNHCPGITDRTLACLQGKPLVRLEIDSGNFTAAGLAHLAKLPWRLTA